MPFLPVSHLQKQRMCKYRGFSQLKKFIRIDQRLEKTGYCENKWTEIGSLWWNISVSYPQTDTYEAGPISWAKQSRRFPTGLKLFLPTKVSAFCLLSLIFTSCYFLLRTPKPVAITRFHGSNITSDNIIWHWINKSLASSGFRVWDAGKDCNWLLL